MMMWLVSHHPLQRCCTLASRNVWLELVSLHPLDCIQILQDGVAGVTPFIAETVHHPLSGGVTYFRQAKVSDCVSIRSSFLLLSTQPFKVVHQVSLGRVRPGVDGPVVILPPGQPQESSASDLLLTNLACL